uniref:Uncharacterized protein n=1 Tax=Arundo donax TaxID=35708 RepID=A0A0A8ZXF0_ARUDO
MCHAQLVNLVIVLCFSYLWLHACMSASVI